MWYQAACRKAPSVCLLAGASGEGWISAAERAGKRLDIPLDAYRFGKDLESSGGENAHGIGADGALLVRPDGFVAWRVKAASIDPEADFERALSHLLCREPASYPAHG